MSRQPLRHPGSPIIIHDDDRHGPGCIRDGIQLIDLTCDNDEDGNQQIRDEVGAIIDLTGDEPPHIQPHVVLPNLAYPFHGHHPLQHNGFSVQIGSYFEIPRIQDNHLIQFLKVTAITHSPHGGCVVYGLPFTRTRNLGGRLPLKLNEVCMIVESTHGDPRPEDQQSTIAVALEEVIKPRDLVCTNASYSTFKYKPPRGASLQDLQHGEDNGRLVCRWKYKRTWKNAQTRRAGGPPSEYAFLRMDPEELTAGYCVDEMERFKAWRAGRVVRGRAVARREHAARDIQPRGHHGYSFGDFFAGAGGASCGARDARLNVQAACELAKVACKTYRANFPGTRLYETDIFHFLHPEKSEVRLDIDHDQLDIIHVSPPCQPFSVAHSTPGKNDEIRWKIVDLRDWGVPMRRLRLIMIGSCPGEPLPEFPANSHSEHGLGNLRRWNTVNMALGKIPNNRARQEDDYDLAQTKHFDIPKAAWDGNIALPRTIITSGARDYHPSGTREFTLRELATLCGFPVRHEFTGTKGEKRRQVGNCFPSIAAKHLFSHIRKVMERTDQARKAAAPEIIEISDTEEDQDVIMID
ncbi:C-5 cytosine-specific DNA methylase [Apiospora kogelbergensis]|uniref:C-5 cytosine-specific DNA methylase n=1 Tax=Apiospora kogelbergensis TaxID=1337665 RepID=UPI00312FFEF5